MYVLISHSDPLGNPTELSGGSPNSGAANGEYRGENSLRERHVPLIPTVVLGSTNQSGFHKVEEKSSISCKGKVKLKSL